MNTLTYDGYTFTQCASDPNMYHVSLMTPDGVVYGGVVCIYVDGDFSYALSTAKRRCKDILDKSDATKEETNEYTEIRRLCT